MSKMSFEGHSQNPQKIDAGLKLEWRFYQMKLELSCIKGFSVNHLKYLKKQACSCQ